MDRASEVGITNLGPVPEGMEFLEAVASVEGQRKHDINPEHQSKRLTLCEALREIWRIAEWCESTWGPEDGVVWWGSHRNHLAPDWKVMFFPGTPKPWDVTSDAWVELNWRRSDLWDEAAQMARKRKAS